MSDQARDVVRYIKAIEDTGGYRTEWFQSSREPFAFYCMPIMTADGQRARKLDASWQANLEAAARYVIKRNAAT